jgi:GntR family transcriptional regulator
MLAQLTLDRNGEVSLYRQLRAAIEMAIIDGALPDGAALPSVRRLASALQIAPITVVQAYRDLQNEALIRSVPKRGYFVSIQPEQDGAAVDLSRISALIDNAIKAAAEAGVDGPQFLRLAAERLRQPRPSRRLVVVMGQRDANLGGRVEVVGRTLADLGIEVGGLAFEDLEAAPFDPNAMSWADAEIFLAPVGEVHRAAKLIGNRASRLVPMTRTIRDDVRDFIQNQPAETRFGIIGASDEFAERILAVVRRHHPLLVPPLSTHVSDPAGVETVIAHSDAIVIGSIARARLGYDLPPDKPSIEFASIPDEGTLEKLRRMLG